VRTGDVSGTDQLVRCRIAASRAASASRDLMTARML
jgi:hypothetical protein